MLVLLLGMILVEAGVIVSLMFKTPARKVVMGGLERMKRGRGPTVVKSVAGTVLAVLASSLSSLVKMAPDPRLDVSPTEQVLMARQLLEASLMGFVLFLAVLTDRLHHYMRELRLRRKSTLDAVKRNDGKFGGVEEILAREQQVGTFKDIVRQLESELQHKSQELAAAQANIDAFNNQSQRLLLQYDRLLSNSHEFRSRLHQSLPSPPSSSKNSLCFTLQS